MKIILKKTQKIRNKQILKYIKQKEKHLDIGCGKEKYLLENSPCKIKIGLDKIYGQEIKNKILLNKKFDYITMAAVIEHMEYPKIIIKECHRLLKADGLLILTTPTKLANYLVRIYAPKEQKQHLYIFNKQKLIKLISPYFKIKKYKKFEFGLNQLIVAKKNENIK